MQFSIPLIIAFLAATTTAAVIEERASNKANEYASGDCSGKLNYGHHGGTSSPGRCINMDATTHSVYTARLSPRLTAYSRPGCMDVWRIGGVRDSPACKNLDNEFAGVRIGSLKFD